MLNKNTHPSCCDGYIFFWSKSSNHNCKTNEKEWSKMGKIMLRIVLCYYGFFDRLLIHLFICLYYCYSCASSFLYIIVIDASHNFFVSLLLRCLAICLYHCYWRVSSFICITVTDVSRHFFTSLITPYIYLYNII